MRGLARAPFAAMTHALAPHQHIAFVEDRTIALDVGSDRYRLFGPRETRTLRTLIAGKESDDEAALERLHVQGLLASNGRPIAAVTHGLPVRSALEMPLSQNARLPLGRVASAVARATFDLRFRGLRKCLEATARLCAGVEAEHAIRIEMRGAPIVGLAQSYARQRKRVPIAPICLRDSLALRALLAAAGYRTTLVIAVRLAPFAAHCWLQAGEMLLNDACDYVSGYTPILVL